MARPYKRVRYQDTNGFQYPYWDIKTADALPTSPSPTPSITPTNTVTPTITPTNTPTTSPGGSPTPTTTVTPTPSITPSLTPTSSITPTLTPTPSVSNNLSVPPTNLFINNLPNLNGENFNGCYTYNEVSYMQIAANPTYRSGANSRDSLSYASYTLNTDSTQKIVIITDRSTSPTGFTAFDIDDTGISGFTDGQSMGTSWTASYAFPEMSQALNGVYFPKAGTYQWASINWTLSYSCP